MNIRQIQEARELFGIDDWGAGYFGINDQGHVVAYPNGDEKSVVSLPEVLMKARDAGVTTPVILRFPQIIESQLQRLHNAFGDAIREYNFQGRHIGVFPFKVNQRREVIDAIVSCGRRLDYGLEVGSKAEMLAAMSYSMSENALLVVNGFKDSEFIDMAFIAKAMGKRVVVVVEGPEELDLIIDRARAGGPCPDIGLRIRLYSRGSGKWEKSSGDTSKFGLTTSEVLHSLDIIRGAGVELNLAMLHFHIGSQITEIKRFKNAIKEASRVYAKVVKSGFKPAYLNIGGGVGVDYDGSKTSYLSSANYSLQEFANDAVYVLGEVCNQEQVPHPTIVTESGRIIAAYHSVIVTDIREVQGSGSVVPADTHEQRDPVDNETHKSLKELQYILENINRKNFAEFYHDAIEYHEELFTLFNLGYLDLSDRAKAEELFQRICRKALYYSSFQRHVPSELDVLQRQMTNKYLANFSMFQSIPDAWAIDHLFPVMPLSRHHEKPSFKATIVDITCDSDGCLDRFVDHRAERTSLDLHNPNGSPYYLGFFLVGAYQESLANEHNLFGAINEVEIFVGDNRDWEIVKVTEGDSVDELLSCRNYVSSEIQGAFDLQLQEAEKRQLIGSSELSAMSARLARYMCSHPYLLKRGTVPAAIDNSLRY